MFSWAHLGLVVLGGALGTSARAGLTLAVGSSLGPAFVPAVNVVGAFALGIVLGVLSRSELSPRRRGAQLFLGAGVLGGFTTYSALAIDSADVANLAWGIGTVVAGTAAAWAGLALARRRAPA